MKVGTTGRNTIFVPIENIIILERSRIDKGDIEDLAHRIETKGLIQPITLNQNMELLAGERRLLAHQFLKRDTIEALIRPTESKIDALEIELIENLARKDMTWQETALLEKKIFDLKAKNGHWNQRKQAEMLQQSQASTARNIQMAEALETLPELAERSTFAEAWKELKALEEEVVVRALAAKSPPIKVSKGMKWAQDAYHVGDAFALMKKVPKEALHFAEIDPPYAVELDKRKSRNKRANMEEYNEVDPDEYINFYERTASEVFRILRKDSFAVFWFGWDWFSEVRGILLKAGFKVPTVPAIWTKGSSGQTASPDTTLGSCHEPFWLARKGQPKLKKAGHGNVFEFSPVPAQKKIHPTERPVELMDEILGTILWPGSAILVPFLGSGVTLRSAFRLGHTGWGYDLSEENKRRFLKSFEKEINPEEETEEEVA